MRPLPMELTQEEEIKRRHRIEYQRARYSPVKKKNEQERAARFLKKYPNWEQKKTVLTQKELFLINQYYGLTPPRLSGGQLAKMFKVTSTAIYKWLKIAEAKLEN